MTFKNFLLFLKTGAILFLANSYQFYDQNLHTSVYVYARLVCLLLDHCAIKTITHSVWFTNNVSRITHGYYFTLDGGHVFVILKKNAGFPTSGQKTNIISIFFSFLFFLHICLCVRSTLFLLFCTIFSVTNSRSIWRFVNIFIFRLKTVPKPFRTSLSLFV